VGVNRATEIESNFLNNIPTLLTNLLSDNFFVCVNEAKACIRLVSTLER